MGRMIGTIIGLAISSLIFALIIQLASKIMFKEAVEYVDAFKTSLLGMILGMVAGMGVDAMKTDFNLLIELGVQFAIWTFAIMVFIGLDLIKSLILALLSLVISYGLVMVIGLILGVMFAA